MSRTNRAGKETAHVLLLVAAALIWGFAFVSQSIGASFVGACTFQAFRSWIAVAALLPVLAAAERIRLRKGMPSALPKGREQTKRFLAGGLLCGVALFLASTTQQYGIGMTTTAKAGFITAMYVVLVPVISLFLGSVPSGRIWFCVALGVLGLYFLCIRPGSAGGFGCGDLILLLCAFLFSAQILLVNHYVQFIDGIWLCWMQMLATAVLATAAMLLFEHPTAPALRAALPSLLYAGVMSSGVAYTFQMIGEEGLDPTVASLAMCLESVFSALGGWLILGQTLNGRETAGCILMFAAIVLSQLRLPAVTRRERRA